MSTIDISTLINWVVAGFIGLAFGIVSAWVTYRFERKRDDTAWEREKTKFHQQAENDRQEAEEYRRYRELDLEIKIKELELQLNEQNEKRIRDELLKGVDNFDDSLAALKAMQRELGMQMMKERDSINRARRLEQEHQIWSSRTRLLSKLPQIIPTMTLASILFIIAPQIALIALGLVLLLEFMITAGISRYSKGEK